MEVDPRAIHRRVSLRLVTLLLAAYVVAILDRVNVAFAALQMTGDLHLSDKAFGLGAGLFSLGYFLLDIPGALVAEHRSARRWIGRVMVTWGFVTAGMGAVQSANQFYAARLLLGIAEAGFLPAMMVYLRHWFVAEERAKAVALAMSAVWVSNAIGAPLAGFLMQIHWLGLPGWRWLFILDGLPAIVLGCVVYVRLTDRPADASWLTAGEKRWIEDGLAREAAAERPSAAGEAFRTPATYALATADFMSRIASYGLILWLPTIVKRASHYSDLRVTLLVSLPYAVALGVSLWNGWHSDHTGERRWHAGLPMLVGACAFALLVPTTAVAPSIALCAVAACGLGGFFAVFWVLPSRVLNASAAAASLGFIGSVGAVGGFVGPMAVGYLRQRYGSFAPAFGLMAGAMCLSGLTILSMRRSLGEGGNSGGAGHCAGAVRGDR